MKFAGGEPFLDLSSRVRFPQAVVVERDHLNFSEALGTPAQNRFCTPNNQQPLSLDGDPCCLCRHGLLHFVPVWQHPGPDARMLLERRIKSPQSRHQKISKISQRLLLKEGKRLRIASGVWPYIGGGRR